MTAPQTRDFVAALGVICIVGAGFLVWLPLGLLVLGVSLVAVAAIMAVKRDGT